MQSRTATSARRGIEFCADVLDLTTAEVSGVATFYTQYKRHPNGDYTVGVCTNTLCAIMGGDQIFEDAVATTSASATTRPPTDGAITLERVECNAACDYAPVVMVNWEFFDNQTPASRPTAGRRPARRRSRSCPPAAPDTVCTFKQISRVLAGFDDGRADEGVGAGRRRRCEGLRLARAERLDRAGRPTARAGRRRRAAAEPTRSRGEHVRAPSAAARRRHVLAQPASTTKQTPDDGEGGRA